MIKKRAVNNLVLCDDDMQKTERTSAEERGEKTHTSQQLPVGAFSRQQIYFSLVVRLYVNMRSWPSECRWKRMNPK
jgi:hypothetical protein